MLLLLLACVAPEPMDPMPPSPHGAGEVQGVTISTPTWGWEWATDEMVDTLRTWRDDGGTWVAYHPYARIERDGTVSWRTWDDAPPDWLVRPIAEAHALGLQVMVKPHLAYWGSGFSWRGDIHFDDPEARERFFTSYRDWVVTVAAATAEADAFVVGTELDQLHDEARWRDIIAGVRDVNPGHLTYAANWDQAARVPFWDALDAVGVQGYHPVARGAEPTRTELEAGWRRILGELRTLHHRTGKPVVLTELGYPRHAKAAVEPWTAGDHGARWEPLQLECLDVALEAIASEPAVVGAFLWKAFPGDRQPSDFSVQTPAVRQLVREHWGTR